MSAPALAGVPGSNGSLYIGMMSGTSIDGVDAVLAQSSPDGQLRTRARTSLDIDATLRDQLMALQQSGSDEMVRAAVAGNAIAHRYADAVGELLADARTTPELAELRATDIVAIGAHGQTVRHRPELGFTVQLLNGALLAELTGIDVVCDLRSADIAAGGQGAPLAPGYHAAVFGHPARRRIVVNIGGIGNVSLLAPGEPVIGFDTGPGNVLMDAWVDRHRQQRFDDNGDWAASGNTDPALLACLLDEPYFALAAPKSTGRDLFDLPWLLDKLDACRPAGDGSARGRAPDANAIPSSGPSPADVQSTLADLTVTSIADACRGFGAQEVFICGGGARNGELMRRLQVNFAPAAVDSTAALGIDPQSVEALAFAWLARQRLHGLAGNLPSVTGARRPVVSGALHRARVAR